MIEYSCYNDIKGKEIAEDLLKIEAIKLQPNDPFTWASGWSSPIYCDNRLSLSYPAVRTKVKEAFAELINTKYKQVDAIAGVATAGIPQGALVADALDIPFIYVRSKSKSHGLANQIEGRVKSDMKVVVLEDLVSTGGSSLAAVEALRDAKIEVLGMVSIFTYGFPIAEENFRNAKVNLTFLSNYELLIESAIDQQLISNELKEKLNQWRKDPANWSA
ncbi:MAG: orotate phosphoribosyltransferase [Cyclobacteriaceae bacterium]